MTFSHQQVADLARLKTETQAADKRARDRLAALERRMDDAEAFEAYIRDDLYPYLVTLATFVIFTAPPEPPA